jgi:putative endonuclease
MQYVYVLKSEIKSFIYVGNCSDLRRRFADHDAKRVRSTKFYAPFRLVYYEAYADKKDALNREYKLKHHGSAIAKLKERLKYSLDI